MNIYSYILIGLFSLFLLNSEEKREKYARQSFWNKIDILSENNIISKLFITAYNPKKLFYLERKKLLKKYMDVISYTSKIDLKRLQTLNVISFFLTAFLQVVIFLLSFLNILVHQKRLQILANAIGDTVLQYPKLNLRLLIFFLLISIFGYFIPYIVLKINSIIYGKKIQKEALMIQAYTITMLGTGKSIKYVIEVLYARSNVFKEVFRKTLHKYSFNQEEAISELKEKSNIPAFSSSINALEKGLIYDRVSAKKYLRSSKKLENSLRKANLSKTNKNKKAIGTILLILPLLSFCTVSGYPWFISVLKMLSNLNGL